MSSAAYWSPFSENFQNLFLQTVRSFNVVKKNNNTILCKDVNI